MLVCLAPSEIETTAPIQGVLNRGSLPMTHTEVARRTFHQALNDIAVPTRSNRSVAGPPFGGVARGTVVAHSQAPQRQRVRRPLPSPRNIPNSPPASKSLRETLERKKPSNVNGPFTLNARKDAPPS